MKSSIKIIFLLFFGFFLSKEKTANAQSQTFNYTGALQTWTVPCTSSIIITANGASGGASTGYAYDLPGLGAQIVSPSINITPGDKIDVIVGGAGTTGNYGGGGGGGTYIWDVTTSALLVVAGGGGGAGYYTSAYSGGNGQTNTGILNTPTDGSPGGNTAAGGSGGNGGVGGSGNCWDGAGGAGWSSNGGVGTGSSSGTVNGGSDPANGGAGGTGGNNYGVSGGYGGGGGGDVAGGGGGGYNGGGGGYGCYPYGGGGGGGSYCITGTPTTSTNSGNGSVTITWAPASALTGTGNIISNVSCKGSSDGKASATISGGGNSYTYSWAPSGGSKDTASGLSAGTYTVTVKDACANTVTAIVTITEPNALSVKANAVANVNCNGGADGSASSSVSGGTSPYTYAWTGGGTNATVSGLSAGTYTLSVTDSHGCTGSATAIITEPVALNATAGTSANVLCHGDANGSASSKASGGTSPYTYLWTGGGTNATVSGLSAGTYTVSIKDSHGCTATATATITQPTAVSDSISRVNVLCNGGNNGSASATVKGGKSPYIYAWSPSGGTKATASGLSAGTYTLTIKDSNGCTTTAAAVITEPTAIAVVPKSIPDDGSCTGSAWVTVSGGTSPYKYKWSPGGETTDSITSLCQDSTYCCMITDENGCTVDSVCETIILGIPVISQASSIKIYPDPNNGYFSISGVKKGQIIEVYNYMGEKLSSTVAENNSVMHIDISDRVNGIYLVRIENSGSTLVTEKKIMKIR